MSRVDIFLQYVIIILICLRMRHKYRVLTEDFTIQTYMSMPFIITSNRAMPENGIVCVQNNVRDLTQHFNVICFKNPSDIR